MVYPSKGWEILEEIEKITQTSEDKIEGATALLKNVSQSGKGVKSLGQVCSGICPGGFVR